MNGAVERWLVFAREDLRMADLLVLIPPDLMGELNDALRLLDRFYIPTRYPDAKAGCPPAWTGAPTQVDARLQAL